MFLLLEVILHSGQVFIEVGHALRPAAGPDRDTPPVIHLVNVFIHDMKRHPARLDADQTVPNLLGHLLLVISIFHPQKCLYRNPVVDATQHKSRGTESYG